MAEKSNRGALSPGSAVVGIAEKLAHRRYRGSADAIHDLAHHVENVVDLAVAESQIDFFREFDGFVRFTLGGMLNRVKEEGWYEDAYRSFEHFVKLHSD